MKPIFKDGKQVCPQGMTLVTRKGHSRKGYTKNDGSSVRSSLVSKSEYCIAKNSNKDEKISIPLKPQMDASHMGRKKGFLRYHGYGIKKPVNQRHISLDKAVTDYGPEPVWHKLNALATINKYNPMKSRVFRADRNYVKNTHNPVLGRKKKRTRGWKPPTRIKKGISYRKKRR